MTPAPKRRWFAYSLRTLFVVVTVFGCWLGLELKFIHEREACAVRISQAGGGVAAYPNVFRGSQRWPPPRIPLWRRWLGDRPFDGMMVPPEWPEAEAKQARSLFPEAFVAWRGKQLSP